MGQRSLFSRSDDEGESWSEPAEAFTPPAIDGKPGLFRALAMTSLGKRRVLAVLYWVDHSRPSLPFFNETTEGLLDSRIFRVCHVDPGGPRGVLADLPDDAPGRDLAEVGSEHDHDRRADWPGASQA